MSNAWGELTWSTGDWGQQANATVQVTGSSSTSSIGNEDIRLDTPVNVTGSQLAGSLGQLTTTSLEEGWGARTWGFSTWGQVGNVLPDGVSASISASPLTITGDANIDVTGISITPTTGNAGSRIDTSASLTTAGLLSSNTGTVEFSITADVPVTGSSVTSDIGNGDGFNTTGWGRLAWGAADWGEGADETVVVTGNAAASAVGTTDQQADGNVFVNVTEHTINTFIGNEDSFTDVDISVTGQSLTSSIGDETAFTDVTISATGLSLTGTLGSVVAGLKTPVDVTTAGLLSTAVGQAEAPDSSAEITGIELTTGIGSTIISTWNEVDTGTEVIWSDVDIAA